VQKNNFQVFLLFAIEMAILSVFLQKKAIVILGLKYDQSNNSTYSPHNRKIAAFGCPYFK